jgi:hypothetical protein
MPVSRYCEPPMRDGLVAFADAVGIYAGEDGFEDFPSLSGPRLLWRLDTLAEEITQALHK